MSMSAGKDWLLLLGGLLVWAAHFFLLYAFASIFPGSDLARWLTLAATLAGLLANAAIIRTAISTRRALSSDDIRGWTSQVALPEAALSIAAIFWQGLPALF